MDPVLSIINETSAGLRPITGHLTFQRPLRFQVPSIKRHIEYTVTLACPEYDAGNPCPGCFLPKQHELALAKDPRFDSGINEYEIEPRRIISNLLWLLGEGYNTVTLMGGEPLALGRFEEVVRFISDSPLSSVLYVGLPKLFLDENLRLNGRTALYEDAGLFDKGRFGFLKFSTDRLLVQQADIPQQTGPLRSSGVKTFYGLRVAEQLAEKGLPACIHQTICSYNIDETLPLYYWAKERHLRFSCSPLVYGWRSPKYKTREELEAAYPLRLTEDHRSRLHEIASTLLSEAFGQIDAGKERLVVPSSAFLRLLPFYGTRNNISCFSRPGLDTLNRNGIQPDIQDIYPDGLKRYCIAQDSESAAKHCDGCFGSAGVDRSNGYFAFEAALLQPGDRRFLNGDVWMKSEEGAAEAYQYHSAEEQAALS